MPLLAIAALVRKDLHIFWTDRRAVVLTLAIPIVIASFFGSIFGNPGTQEAAKVPVAIVDQDQSAISTSLVSGTAGDSALEVRALPLDDAKAAVQAGRVPVAIVIPPGFGDAAGRAFFTQAVRPQLQLLTDPSKSAEVAMVRGLLSAHAMQAVSQEMFGGPQGQRLADETLDSLDSNGMPADQRALLRQMLESSQRLARAQSASGTPRRGMTIPYEVQESQVTGNPLATYNGYAHSFAGMGIQFALFAGIELAVGILLERQRGLWKRLRSAPLSRTALLLAKTCSGTLLTATTLVASFLFASAVFGVRFSSPAGFVGVVIASALMASTFGLLLASVGRTPEATRRVAIFVVLVSVMLGGAWVPSFLFPAWLQQLTWLVPVRWAVDGLEAVTWRGLGLADVLVPIGLLLGFSAVCATLAVWRFRWEEA
jgi:ABC-2 type transport system permease protein